MKSTCPSSCALLLIACTSLSFAQLPVTENLELWLDATDVGSLILDDGFVRQWSDKRGNNFHAVPAVDAGLPTWTADAMNGEPSVRFADATADGMEIDGFFLDTRPCTAFVVNQYWGDIRGRTLQGADSNWLLGLWAGNIGHYAQGWVTPQQPACNEVYVADAVGTETESFMAVNGFDYTNNLSPLGTPGGLGLVGSGAYPNELSDADISEVIFYN